jgi:hypothetical protein
LSKNYFSTETNNGGLALDHVDYAPAISVTNSIQWLDENPIFIKQFQAFAPNYISIQGNIIQLTNAYKSGYLVWELTLSSITNIEGTVFPLGFQYRQYFPKFKKPIDAQDTLMIYEADFRVTRISPYVVNKILLPETGENVKVADMRFGNTLTLTNSPNRSTIGLMYYISNGHWKSRADASSHAKAVQITTQINAAQYPINNKSTKIFRCIFAIMAFIPILILSEHWRKVKNKQTNKQHKKI